MPIDAASVGANQRQIMIIGDPTSAGNQQNIILAAGDGKFVAGQYAGLIVSVPVLENAATSLDIQRAAVGTTGVAAVSTESTKATYSCGVIGYAGYATPTDLFVLVGSATKVIRVLRFSVSGTATAAISEDIQLVKRTAADTTGTASQPAIAQHDSNDAAASAVVNLYSVIPGGLGAGVNVRTARLNLGVTGAAGTVAWDFTNRNGKGIVLRGIAQCLALNWNGAAVPAGINLDIDVEFTEE
jgi:hypothetical protein